MQATEPSIALLLPSGLSTILQTCCAPLGMLLHMWPWVVLDSAPVVPPWTHVTRMIAWSLLGLMDDAASADLQVDNAARRCEPRVA